MVVTRERDETVVAMQAAMPRAEHADLIASWQGTRTRGADVVCRALIEEGVETVFGYPGGAVIPLYDAIPRYPFHHVLVRHEQMAAHMADGYARATGKVGVCIATSGPGATNLVTGIATAMMDSSPMVAITGNVVRYADRQGRLPGDGHHRRHAADHQAQLLLQDGGGDRADAARRRSTSRAPAAPARCSWTSRRTASSKRSTYEYPRAVSLPGYRPTIMPNHRQIRTRREAAARGGEADHHRRAGRPDRGGRRRNCSSWRRRPDSGREHLARPRLLPGEPPALDGPPGHARPRAHEPRRQPRRRDARRRHALRRPRHGPPLLLRAQRQGHPHGHRPGGDRQERPRRRAGRRRREGEPAHARRRTGADDARRSGSRRSRR